MADDLRKNLEELLKKYQTVGGAADTRTAIRDLLTDIHHICHENSLDFDSIGTAAKEVCHEELNEGEQDEIDTFSIPAECHSDDRNIECNFDAVQWMKDASDECIVELAKCGWGGDYPADEVAICQADLDKKVAEMFRYLEIIKGDRTKKDVCGFECHVDEDKALAWLKTNRPSTFAKIEALKEA